MTKRVKQPKSRQSEKSKDFSSFRHFHAFYRVCGRFWGHFIQSFLIDVVVDYFENRFIKFINLLSFGRYQLFRDGILHALVSRKGLNWVKLKRHYKTIMKWVFGFGEQFGYGLSYLLLPFVFMATVILDLISISINECTNQNIDLSNTLIKVLHWISNFVYEHKNLLILFVLPSYYACCTQELNILLDFAVLISSIIFNSQIVNVMTKWILNSISSYTLPKWPLDSFIKGCINVLQIPALVFGLCALTKQTGLYGKYYSKVLLKYPVECLKQVLLVGSIYAFYAPVSKKYKDTDKKNSAADASQLLFRRTSKYILKKYDVSKIHQVRENFKPKTLKTKLTDLHKRQKFKMA